MNIFKLVSLLTILLLLSSCSKSDQCDNITLTVNNLLSSPLDSIMIGNVNFGTIDAGETEVICLESSMGYDGSTSYLCLYIQALYQEESVQSGGVFCGTGLVPVQSGEFELDLTAIDENYLTYVFK